MEGEGENLLALQRVARKQDGNCTRTLEKKEPASRFFEKVWIHR